MVHANGKNNNNETNRKYAHVLFVTFNWLQYHVDAEYMPWPGIDKIWATKSKVKVFQAIGYRLSS